jgi:ABC-type transport system involved in multi-copper enzyme maturation permease subunit
MLITFEALGAWVIPYAKVAALLAGLSLGASGVGGEYGAGTMPFVLTRPAPRRNLLFTDWAIGLTAIVIVVGSLAFCVFPFLCYARAQGPGNVLIALPGLWVWAAAIYGLASFTTLVAGSASKGLVLSAAVVLTYGFLPDALHSWWHVEALLKARDWTLQIFNGGWDVFFNGASVQFHWGAIAFWLAVAAGFLGASVAWIQYREL